MRDRRAADSRLIKRHVYLVGFSGSGKSTIGPLLASRMKRPFGDSDAAIVRSSQMSIAKIFSERGEPAFRRLESKVILELSGHKVSTVVALGGGALLSRANRTIVFKTGVVVYLRCSKRELHRRLKPQTDRPLLRGQTLKLEHQIDKLLTLRERGYKMADVTVSTTARTPHRVAGEIAAALKRKYGAY